MAHVKNTTPKPTSQTFEVSLTHDEISVLTNTATALYTHSKAIKHILNKGVFNQDLEQALALLLAFDPSDPLDAIDEVDDEFLATVEIFKL